MKKKLSLAIVASMALLGSCSKSIDPVVTPPVVPPKVDTTSASDKLTKQNVSQYMVDKNATPQTIALFYNLKILSKTKFAVGQQAAFDGFYKNVGGMSDIKKSTGSDPAVLGSDFLFITDKANDGTSGNWFYQQEVATINNVIKAYNDGIINIFCWHLREPYNEKSFYASDMTALEKTKAFKSILVGGENHDWYKAKLDKIASVFNKLKGKNGELIPVIFRPFHEYDGSWFWWGADFCTAEEYKTAFKFTVDYLKNTKGVHNVLYSLGPDNSYDTKEKYLIRYPGDDYVDILGMDNYGDLRSGAGITGSNLANKKLKVISDLAKEKVKIAAFTETGFQVTPTVPPVTGWFSNFLLNTITANNLEIAFVMLWGNSGDSYYVPTPSTSNVTDFVDFTKSPKAVLQNNLPNMYTISN